LVGRGRCVVLDADTLGPAMIVHRRRKGSPPHHLHLPTTHLSPHHRPAHFPHHAATPHLPLPPPTRPAHLLQPAAPTSHPPAHTPPNTPTAAYLSLDGRRSHGRRPGRRVRGSTSALLAAYHVRAGALNVLAATSWQTGSASHSRRQHVAEQHRTLPNKGPFRCGSALVMAMHAAGRLYGRRRRRRLLNVIL